MLTFSRLFVQQLLQVVECRLVPFSFLLICPGDSHSLSQLQSTCITRVEGVIVRHIHMVPVIPVPCRSTAANLRQAVQSCCCLPEHLCRAEKFSEYFSYRRACIKRSSYSGQHPLLSFDGAAPAAQRKTWSVTCVPIATVERHWWVWQPLLKRGQKGDKRRQIKSQ